MAIILREPERGASDVVSQNLQQGINLLINQKMQDLQSQRETQRSRMKAEQATPAIDALLQGRQLTPDEITQVAQFNPGLLKSALGQGALVPQNKALAEIGSRTRTAPTPGTMPIDQGQPTIEGAETSREISQAGPVAPTSIESQIADAKDQLDFETQRYNDAALINPVKAAGFKEQARLANERLKSLEKQRDTAKSRAISERKLNLAEDKPIHQYNLDLFKKYESEGESARKGIATYNNVIDIVQKGDVKTGANAKILEGLGLTDIFATPSENLLDKLYASQAINIPEAFRGSRGITDFKEQLFQKTIGQRTNTPQGQIGVAGVIQSAMRSEEARANIGRKIREENNGRLPLNYNEELYKLWEPERKKNEEIANFITTHADQIYIPPKGKKSEYPPATKFPIGTKKQDDNYYLYSMGNFWIRIPKNQGQK